MRKLNKFWICPMLLLALVLILSNSCKKEVKLFAITTSTVNNISYNTAGCGGNITSDGGSSVTVRGVCWSVSHNPTVADNLTTDGTGSGSFNSNLSGLTAKTTYFVRAYATNGSGTTYGNEISFTTIPFPNCGTVTDYDGNIYHTVTIGTQCWMVENLKTTHYRNGISIPDVPAWGDWSILASGAYCNYDNNDTNANIYGRLYNFYAANNSNNIAPAGWHLPTQDEWTTLEHYLMSNGYNYDRIWDGTFSDSKISKAMAAQILWAPATGTGFVGNDLTLNNKTDFTALPGGDRGSGDFEEMGIFGNWWSSSNDGIEAIYEYIHSENNHPLQDASQLTAGLSIRCVKD